MMLARRLAQQVLHGPQQQRSQMSCVLLQDISMVSWTGHWGLEAAEYRSHHATLMIGPHIQQF